MTSSRGSHAVGHIIVLYCTMYPHACQHFYDPLGIMMVPILLL